MPKYIDKKLKISLIKFLESLKHFQDNFFLNDAIPIGDSHSALGMKNPQFWQYPQQLGRRHRKILNLKLLSQMTTYLKTLKVHSECAFYKLI